MKLTKLQLKLLNFYAKYQTEPLTMFGIARAFWLAWLLLLLVPAAGWLCFRVGLPALGWIYIGAALGAFGRDVNRILALFRTWPVLHQIINWERLREILQASKKDGV